MATESVLSKSLKRILNHFRTIMSNVYYQNALFTKMSIPWRGLTLWKKYRSEIIFNNNFNLAVTFNMVDFEK